MRMKSKDGVRSLALQDVCQKYRILTSIHQICGRLPIQITFYLARPAAAGPRASGAHSPGLSREGAALRVAPAAGSRDLPCSRARDPGRRRKGEESRAAPRGTLAQGAFQLRRLQPRPARSPEAPQPETGTPPPSQGPGALPDAGAPRTSGCEPPGHPTGLRSNDSPEPPNSYLRPPRGPAAVPRRLAAQLAGGSREPGAPGSPGPGSAGAGTRATGPGALARRPGPSGRVSSAPPERLGRPRRPLTHSFWAGRGAAQRTPAAASPPLPFPLSLRKQKEPAGLQGCPSPSEGKFRPPPACPRGAGRSWRPPAARPRPTAWKNTPEFPPTWGPGSRRVPAPSALLWGPRPFPAPPMPEGVSVCSGWGGEQGRRVLPPPGCRRRRELPGTAARPPQVSVQVTHAGR
ncbi:PREDICTED: basic proline-rich protein-like [Lipotes vexillifer]|uniref:Basic proline-rich protein-like n=1 Tax=Lipotes vexillifer TaxID=118797 RepID=A0A340YHV1_LIPVE|nr:PREDICTED: basic proline-rich protein-like [Lipotes vexillifer]